jgi:hypothetical protein
MSHIYLPTGGSHDWQWLLASPGRHWKHGASAMALADAWEYAKPWPAPVAAALNNDPELRDLELLVALPEHEVPLPGGVRPSQTDLFVVARASSGLVTIAVEGKAAEPFGDHTVSEWRAHDSAGRRTRLAHLLEVLQLNDDERLAAIRYQLLHRTASAIIEAGRYGARHAVMLVHSFSPTHAWLDDYRAFARLFDVEADAGTVVRAGELDGVMLHLAWVSDEPRPLDPDPSSLGPRFDRAVALARQLHAPQMRKDTAIPYVSHLLGVTSLVLDDGGTEDEAIAALLHDAVEDQGGPQTLRRINSNSAIVWQRSSLHAPTPT